MKFLELSKCVRVFYLGDNWYCDVVIDYNLRYFEAWLYHSTIGIKEFLFGSNCDLDEEFIKMLLNALENESYIDDYREEYMNE